MVAAVMTGTGLRLKMDLIPHVALMLSFQEIFTLGFSMNPFIDESGVTIQSGILNAQTS